MRLMSREFEFQPETEITELIIEPGTVYCHLKTQTRYMVINHHAGDFENKPMVTSVVIEESLEGQCLANGATSEHVDTIQSVVEVWDIEKMRDAYARTVSKITGDFCPTHPIVNEFITRIQRCMSSPPLTIKRAA